MELGDCLCANGWGTLEEDTDAEKGKMSELKLHVDSLLGFKGSLRKSVMVPLIPDMIPEGMRGSGAEPLLLWVGTAPEPDE